MIIMMIMILVMISGISCKYRHGRISTRTGYPCWNKTYQSCIYPVPSCSWNKNMNSNNNHSKDISTVSPHHTPKLVFNVSCSLRQITS